MGRHGVSSRRHAVRRACGGGAVGRLQRGSQVNLSYYDTSVTLSGLVGRLWVGC
jgi:hypothetical protein